MVKKTFIFAAMAASTAFVQAAVSIDVPMDGEEALYSSTFELIDGYGGDAENTYTWASLPDVQVGANSTDWTFTVSAPEGGLYKYTPPQGDPESGFTYYSLYFEFTWQTDNFTSGPPLIVSNFAGSMVNASSNFGDLGVSPTGILRRVSSVTGGTLILTGQLNANFVPNEVYSFEGLSFSATVIEFIANNAIMGNFTATDGTGRLTAIASTANIYQAPVQPDPGDYFAYQAPVPEPSTYAALAGLGILAFAIYYRRRK